MKHNLYITEKQNAESTTLHYIVEQGEMGATMFELSGADLATGTHILHDGGNPDIRKSLRDAAIAALKLQHGCEYCEIWSSGGIELPDAENVSLGSYRDAIGNI